MTAQVGIVVIGRNEGKRLNACFSALSDNGMPVVYADSASSDGSVTRAEHAGVTVVTLDPARPMNAARGRREGAERLFADHPEIVYVQFLDGDCVIEPGWIDTAVAFLERQPDAAAVCGLRFEASPNASIYNRICNSEWDTPVGEVAAVGGDALMRVAAYRAVGGFDPTILAGEEPELCHRLQAAGWKLWRIDVRMTEHDMAMTSIAQWMARSRRGGFGFAQVWRVTGGRLFFRQLRSAFVWTIGVPLVGVMIALIWGAAWLALIPLAVAMQVARLAARQGIGRGAAWQEAGLAMLGKGNEAIGALTYFLHARGSWPPSLENDAPGGSKMTFGMVEAVLLCLVASVIGCVMAWRSLSG